MDHRYKLLEPICWYLVYPEVTWTELSEGQKQKFHSNNVSREKGFKLKSSMEPNQQVLAPFWHRQFKQHDSGEVPSWQKQTDASRAIADHSSGVAMRKQF
jgi:hypothetical protein